MNTIMSKNNFFLITSILIVFAEGSTCNAQSNFKNRLKQFQNINFKKIEPEVSQQGNITFSQLEKEFLRYEGKGEVKAREVVFYYFKNAKKGYDGLYGANSDNELRNVDNTDKNGKVIPNKPSQINYSNRITLYARLNLNANFYTLIINYETYDRISAFIYNYNQEGLLISAMQLLDNEKDGPEKASRHSVISSTINENGTIDIVTDADFRIDRKVKLDPDGHFRVIEEKVTRYDDK